MIQQRYEQDLSELRTQIDYLEKENKRCIETLIRHSKEPSQQTTQRDLLPSASSKSPLGVNTQHLNLPTPLMQPAISVASITPENPKKPH